jgi:hypothetical protein
MSFHDPMLIIEGPSDYSIGLVNDTRYNPDSADNSVSYNRFYAEQPYAADNYPTRHGIFLLKDGEIESAVCVSASGGPTGIHPRCSILDGDSFLICCADSIFCLTFPDLHLNWITIADQATCFGIYRYENGYIIHGELEITRLDQAGSIIWQFSGSDIFITPTGRDAFTLTGDVIKAASWDGITFTLDAQTGKSIDS